MKFITNSTISLALLAATLLTGCKKDTDTTPTAGVGTVSFDVTHLVGVAPLNLSSDRYTNASGEQFTVSKFDYLLSNFKLQKADGSAYAVPESYVLVSENPSGNSAASGTEFTLANIPVGDYTGLTFMVGVDAARNVAGAQTGALATTDQMFWDWAQGYIFLKMEAKWQPANGLSTDVEYHIGGFADPSNALRTVAPAWPSGTTLFVRSDHAPLIHLDVNLAQLLDGATAADHLSFATLSGIHMPGANALKVASNYSGSTSATAVSTTSMFKVNHIHAN